MGECGRLEGVWRAVLLEEDGRILPSYAAIRTKLTIAGDHYDLELGDLHFTGTISGVSPDCDSGNIDFFREEGFNERGGKMYPGIFMLEDDELTVCVGHPGCDRPREFECRPGSGTWLYLLKRVPVEVVV